MNNRWHFHRLQPETPVLRFYLLIFRERAREREKQCQRDCKQRVSVCDRYRDLLPLAHSQLRAWLATQACALTGN